MKRSDENRDEMLPEYDLSAMSGERGKYYRAYREGHSITIHHEDGTAETQRFELEDGAVMLDPDVKRYFPDSEAVNKALRTLLTIVPARPATAAGKV